MAYGIAEAIAELYIMSRQPPYGLNVYAVQDAASKCGMDLPKFLKAVKDARAPLTDMFKAGARPGMDVWKAIVNLSKSSATTAEFTKAVSTAMGGGFFSIPPAMVILGAIGWGLVGGVVVVGGLAIYYSATTGKPIEAGWQQLVAHVRQVVSPPRHAGVARDPYGVFIGGGYNEVIVGQLSVIMATPSNSLIGWGLNPKPVRDTGARFTMVLGPFANAAQARKAYEDNIIPGSRFVKPAATGTSARFKFDGKPHDIDNALRLLR